MQFPTLSKKQFFLLFSALMTVMQSSVFFLSEPLVFYFIGFSLLSSCVGLFFLLGLDYDLFSISLLLYPIILLLSTQFTHYFYPNTVWFFKFGFSIFFFFLFYVLLLSLNIFRVVANRGEDIPLLRPAETSVFLLTTINSFFAFNAVLKAFNYLPYQVFLIFFVSFGLSFALFYLSLRRGEQAIAAAFFSAIFTTEIFLAFSFAPLETFFRGLMVSAFFYVVISIGKEYFSHRINRRLILEYFSLFFVLGLAALWMSVQE